MANRKLENWIASYAQYTEVSEAPLTFDFWTGVSTIAGALRRQVCIDEIKFRIYPNFYTFFVAPPGVATKSTTVSVGMRLLRQVDGVIMGPSSMTWQGLTKGLQNAQQMVPLQDPTITDPLAMEYFPQSAITCEVSELGTFLDMRNGELISILIDLWDGKDVPWERWLSTKEDTKIENPLISIIGATTPSWLEENFGEGTIGGGLTSRIVFVYGDAKRRFIPYISDLVEDESNRKLEEDLVHDLREIAKLKGRFTITRQARNMVGEWYQKHWTVPEKQINDPKFAGYRARKFSHLHKLAMILSVAESDCLEITHAHITEAFRLLRNIEQDMLKVLTNIGKVVSSKHMDIVAAVLRVWGKSEKQRLWRSCLNSMSAKEFSEALDGLITAKYVYVRNDAGTMYYVWRGIEEAEAEAEAEATEPGLELEPEPGSAVASASVFPLVPRVVSS